MNKHRIIIAIIGLITMGLILIGAFMIFPAQQVNKVNINKFTTALWQSYLKNQWLSEGRTVSNPVNSITTSEGQSYTMLRAVWQNDQNVFNTTWQWTKANLQRKDFLFSWEWGRNPNGSYGIMTANNGQNTAADADCDIGYCPFFQNVCRKLEYYIEMIEVEFMINLFYDQCTDVY